MHGLLLIFLLICVVSGGKYFVRTPVPQNPRVWPTETNNINRVSGRNRNYNSLWELSGLFEGDIAVQYDTNFKNALMNSAKLWKLPIPVYVNSSDFAPKEVNTIEKAISEIEEKTCVRFRRYKKGDPNFIVVRGHKTGCWSLVGREKGGQVLHLQRPACVHHGVIVHEFLHALGLLHQQSSPDRDEYVKIHWDNIEKGFERNFHKYSAVAASTLGLKYDYNSIMHYGSKAFSKNGLPTITPLDGTSQIGQRKNLSTTDALKIQKMYKCAHNTDEYDDYYDDKDDYSYY